MITTDEATKIAKEIIDSLPSKLTEHDPASVNMFLGMLVWELIKSTRTNMGETEASKFLVKHHEVVDALIAYYPLIKDKE